jgi:hypothetical protein
MICASFNKFVEWIYKQIRHRMRYVESLVHTEPAVVAKELGILNATNYRKPLITVLMSLIKTAITGLVLYSLSISWSPVTAL